MRPSSLSGGPTPILGRRGGGGSGGGAFEGGGGCWRRSGWGCRVYLGFSWRGHHNTELSYRASGRNPTFSIGGHNRDLLSCKPNEDEEKKEPGKQVVFRESPVVDGLGRGTGCVLKPEEHMTTVKIQFGRSASKPQGGVPPRVECLGRRLHGLQSAYSAAR